MRSSEVGNNSHAVLARDRPTVGWKTFHDLSYWMRGLKGLSKRWSVYRDQTWQAIRRRPVPGSPPSFGPFFALFACCPLFFCAIPPERSVSFVRLLLFAHMFSRQLSPPSLYLPFYSPSLSFSIPPCLPYFFSVIFSHCYFCLYLSLSSICFRFYHPLLSFCFFCYFLPYCISSLLDQSFSIAFISVVSHYPFHAVFRVISSLSFFLSVVFLNSLIIYAAAATRPFCLLWSVSLSLSVRSLCSCVAYLLFPCCIRVFSCGQLSQTAQLSKGQTSGNDWTEDNLFN